MRTDAQRTKRGRFNWILSSNGESGTEKDSGHKPEERQMLKGPACSDRHRTSVPTLHDRHRNGSRKMQC